MRLLESYGCNIFPGEEEELEGIIRTGEIDPALFERGLRRFMDECRRRTHSSDERRAEYARECIGRAQEKIRTLVPRHGMAAAAG